MSNLTQFNVQLASTVRYLKAINSSETEAKLLTRVLQLNKVKSMDKLTEEQLNKSMHYLYDMEQVLYRYSWCIRYLDDQLLKLLLSRELDNDKSELTRDFNGGEKLGRAVELAPKLVDVGILGCLY